MQSNQAKIEALLFVAGDEGGLSLNQLVELTGLLKPHSQRKLKNWLQITLLILIAVCKSLQHRNDFD